MEEFKELQEYPGYSIGNQGTIIGKYKRALKPRITNGYHYILICVKGEKPKNMLLHRLIGLAWIPNPDKKLYIDHINRNRIDNRIENLRWATFMENNNNKGKNKNNTSGQQGLSFCEGRNRWVVHKTLFGVEYRKRFKTREEAESYLAKVDATHLTKN